MSPPFSSSSCTIRKKLLLILVAIVYPVIAFSSPSAFGSGAFDGPVYSSSPQQSPVSVVYSTILGLRAGDNNEEEEKATTGGGGGDLHLEIDQEENDSFEDDYDDARSTPNNLLKSITIPMTSFITKFGRVYAKSLETSPIATKSFTAGFIFTLSDITAQKLESSRQRNNKKDDNDTSTSMIQKYDYKRTIGAGLVGLLYFGPAAHVWYGWIFKILPAPGIVSTLQKATLGQLIFGPVFTCVFFASALVQSNSFSLNNWLLKIKTDLPGAWLGGICFWPFVDLISYGFIKQNYIPLFVNFCSFIWTIYLSFLANK